MDIDDLALSHPPKPLQASNYPKQLFLLGRALATDPAIYRVGNRPDAKIPGNGKEHGKWPLKNGPKTGICASVLPFSRVFHSVTVSAAIMLCESVCFCLLSTFSAPSMTTPLLRTLLRTSVPIQTLTRRLPRTLLNLSSTSFKEPSKNPSKKRVVA